MDPSADMTVVGLVHDSHIIEDIGIIVPKGTAVAIPGHLTIRSKDLYRALTQRFIMQLHRLPPSAHGAQAAGSLSQAETARLQDEVARLTNQNLALVARGETLETELASTRGKLDSVQAELAKKNAETSKLDDILSAIRDRPQVINQVVQGSSVGSPMVPQERVSSDTPHFIPSQIRSDTTGERIFVEESTSTTSNVADAANRLAALRKKKQ